MTKDEAIKRLQKDTKRGQRFNDLLPLLGGMKAPQQHRYFNRAGYSAANLKSLEYDIKQAYGIKSADLRATAAQASADKEPEPLDIEPLKTPLPVTFIIILNGYIFNKIGFFISLALLLLGSTALYLFAKKVKIFFDLDISKFFLKKKVNISKLTTNNFSILLSRYILPYFIHNIYYGLENIKIKRFILIIFCAEIPSTYALNSIGNSAQNITSDYNVELFNVFSDITFYVPFFIIFTIFILVNYFNRN